MPVLAHFHLILRGCGGPLSVRDGFKAGALAQLAEKAGVRIDRHTMHTYPTGGANFHLDIGKSYLVGTTYPAEKLVVADVSVSLGDATEAKKYRRLARTLKTYFKAGRGSALKEDISA
jgi:hypothetical protein